MLSVIQELFHLFKHVVRICFYGKLVWVILLPLVVSLFPPPHGIGLDALQFSDSIRPTPALLAKAMPVTFSVDENTANLTMLGRLADLIQPKPNPDWRYTIPQNPFFDIFPDSSFRVIGPLDRDENRQLCTEPSYPEECVWTSFAVTGTGQYVGLRVVIHDVNDNEPTWAEPTIIIHVTEELRNTFTAELPVANDPDLGKNGIQGYKLQTELSDADRFELLVKSNTVKSGNRLYGNSGETAMSSRFKLFLHVLKPLDRETLPKHNLTLLAFDGSEPYHTGRLNIIVEVGDENDHSPQFTSKAYTAVVSEDAGVGSLISLHHASFDSVRQSDATGMETTEYLDQTSQLIATDKDVGPNGQILYEFAASTDPQVLELFTLDPHSGQMRVAKPLSYDIRPTGWKFQVLAKDGGRPSRSSSATILIQLKDANTHGPDIKTRLHQPKSYVKRITELGLSQSVHETTNNVIYIPENTPPVSEPLAVFTVGDKDTGPGGEFDCNLSDSEISAKMLTTTFRGDFVLNFTAKLPNWNVYSLYVLRSIDRELAPVRELIITCTDHGQPPRSTREKLNVVLVDENDNAPIFNQGKYQLHILEGNRPNASVGKLRAHDPDDGVNSQVTYRIAWPSAQPVSDRPFLITNEGRLIATKTLDREANPKGYRFKVIASDSGRPISLNSTAEVEVILDDVNDCTPRFLQKQYNFTIEEDYGQNFTVGRWVGQVKAIDCDLGQNGAITYLILDPGMPFEITSNGMLKTTRFIDRELRSVYRLTVLARDGGMEADRVPDGQVQSYETFGPTETFHGVLNHQKARTSAVQVFITVTDVNDHYPIFVYPNSTSYQVRVSMHEKKGFIITRLVAVDKDTGPNGQVRYGIIKGNRLGLFKVRPDTGELFVDQPLSVDHKGTMFLIVEARDLGTPKSHTNSLEIRLIISDEPAIGRKINMLDSTAAGKLSPFDLAVMKTMNGDSSGTIELNKLIMMCIVICTAVVCVIMIVAIGIFVRRTSCHSWFGPGRTRRRAARQTPNGIPMNAERYTNAWDSESNGKPDRYLVPGDEKPGEDQAKTQTGKEMHSDYGPVSAGTGFGTSPKLPLLYDSVTAAKDGHVISYTLDERTIPNRYVDMSHNSPARLAFNGIPASETPAFHLEQNDAVGEKSDYVMSQETGMRLYRPGDTTLCAIHEDPSTSIQLVAIPIVSTEGTYIPFAHQPPCSLTEHKASGDQHSLRQSPLAPSLPPAFDPIAMDSDADSGRGGSVNNIRLNCPLDASIASNTQSLNMTPATVHTLTVPVRYISYTTDQKIHMLTPPSSCPQAVLVPISTVSADTADVTAPAENCMEAPFAIPTCVTKDTTVPAVTGGVTTTPSITMVTTTVTTTTSPSRRADNASGKKRDCGPWRLVQLPTQELEAEIQKY